MDISGLKGDFIKLSLSRIITLIISMISLMLLARLLSLNEYGTYSQILLLVNLSNTLVVLGLPNSINYFLVRTKNIEEKRFFLSVYYTVSTILGFASGLILVIISPLIAKYFNNPYIFNFLFVLALLPWAQIIASSIDSILVVNKKTGWLFSFKLIHSICILSAVIYSKILNLTFLDYMRIFMIIEFVYAIWAYLLAKKSVGKLCIKFEWTLTKQIFDYSLPIGISSIIGTISLYLDKLIIGRLMSIEHVALYSIAGKELPIAIITSSLTAVLLPRFISLFDNGKEKIALDVWKKSITISFALMAFFATSMFVFAPHVVVLLYSDKYLPAVGIFRIYSILLLIRCTYFGMGMTAAGKTKYIMHISSFSLVINIVLNLVLFYLVGFAGPAVATVIATILSAFVYMILNAKVLNAKIKDILSIGELFKILLVNIVLGVLVFLFATKITIGYEFVGIIKIISICGLWFVGYIFIIRKILKNNKDFLMLSES